MTSYVIAHQELTTIGEQMRALRDEDDWVALVAEAGSAMSREHGLWLAHVRERMSS